MQHRYSTRFAAMLQDRLHVLCSPFFRTLRVHSGISKICLIRLVFIYIFFPKKLSALFLSFISKTKIDRKWYRSFFKNDSTCKLYVHNYINYFGLPRFSEHVWHSIFYLCRLPFPIPRLLQWDDLSFYLCFLFVSFILL